MIKACLLHLSYNMWADCEVADSGVEHVSARPDLRLDQTLWDDIAARMAALGLNMAVIDLGDGVRYRSHPEIAVRGAWSPERLREELARIRALGIEPIPKLNFSTCHDVWLGPYSRCVSTPTYYDVCRDLISEVAELFDQPRFFHLGMDEETAEHQRRYEYVVIRQGELWWHDLGVLIEAVERAGVRPWVWSDYVWQHPEEFMARMPRSVLQSNWYYGTEFGADVHYAQAYVDLEAHGYDQVPTGSNWSTPENMARTVAFCREHIAPERLLGFMQTSWKPTLEVCRARHMEALELAGAALADLA
ncbi:MAG: Tat pathway signal protein [Anaerolineales bacterium]|nr:Tat pathway signal protein [Anaerolineales bacterium]